MSNDKPGFDHAPELEPELSAAVWSVIQEPLDADAVSRVKARAMVLAEEENSISVSASEPTVSKAHQTRTLPLTRIVQALAASIAVAVGGWLWFSSSKSAFAQVIEQLRAASTLTYVVETEHEQFKDPIQQRILVAADGRSRHEAGPLVTIHDPAGNVRLVLNTLFKHAYKMDPPNSPESGGSESSEIDEMMKALESGDLKLSDSELAGIKDTLESIDSEFSELNWIQSLRDFAGEPDRELGRRLVEGRQLDGFVVDMGIGEWTIWLDPATHALVRVEFDTPIEGSGLGKTVMKDFRFNVPLDEDLFAYEPPAGYRSKDARILLPENDIPASSEESLVEALRGFTKRSGGKFPKSLANWSDWFDVLEAPESEETKMLTASLGSIFVFLSDMSKEDYEYLGAGKSIDDDRSIVFWHRTENGTLRAVYSDLSVAEIQESELP